MFANIAYRFTAFADYSVLSFSQERMTSMFKAFEDFSLIPSIVPDVISDINSPRMRFITDTGLSIAMMSERIDIEIVSKKREGFSESEKDKAASTLLQCIERIYNTFSLIIQDADRLAWGASFVYADISREDKEKFRDRFLKPISFYDGIITDEFNVQYCGRKPVLLNNSLGEEKINILTSVSNYYGTLSNIDGYLVMFDINTIPENKKNRFNIEGFKIFIDKARKIQKEAGVNFINA